MDDEENVTPEDHLSRRKRKQQSAYLRDESRSLQEDVPAECSDVTLELDDVNECLSLALHPEFSTLASASEDLEHPCVIKRRVVVNIPTCHNEPSQYSRSVQLKSVRETVMADTECDPAHITVAIPDEPAPVVPSQRQRDSNVLRVKNLQTVANVDSEELLDEGWSAVQQISETVPGRGNNQAAEDFPWINTHVDQNDGPPVLYQDITVDSSRKEDTFVAFHGDVAMEEPAINEDTPSSHKNSPLYKGAPITVAESLTAVLTFVQSEHISGVGLARLLSLINLHLPQPNNFCGSSYKLYQMLSSKEPVTMHYLCSICLKSLMSEFDLCDECTDESRFVHYFISLPLVPQVKNMYNRPGFLNDIRYKSRRVKFNANNVEDIYDGELYSEAEKHILAAEANISFMWNTDGVQIFKSSSYSLWPWYLVINELPPEKRFRSENMIVAGIWGCITKPHPNIFLQPIYNDLLALKDGVDVNFHGDSTLHKIHAILLCGTCDAPARAVFLNMKSHSGFYSCHICKCRGENSARTGDVTVFPYSDTFPLRSVNEYQQQVEWAVANNVLLHKTLLNEPQSSGIKGPTLLSYIVSDIFSSTAIDSMHCTFLGGMRQMLHLWFDNSNRDEPFSLFSKIHTVSERLQRITPPPHFIQRKPQSLEKLIYWKASELRAFMFYLSLCVLVDIMKPEYFSHFMLFVQGVALLNTASVSSEDMQISRMLLSQFVEQFEVLYGLRHMSHNIHMLLHLSRTVQHLAPLWATSCFQFEDMNGRLTKLIHGTRHVGLQINSNLSVIQDLPLRVHNLNDGPVKEYCVQLRSKWMQLNVGSKISNGIYCIGRDSNVSDNTRWILDLLVKKGLTAENSGFVQVFHRLLKNGILYVSASYGRGQRESCHVKYTTYDTTYVTDQYGILECFIKVKSCQCVAACSCLTKYFAIIKSLQPTVPFKTNNIDIKHILHCRPAANTVKDVVQIDALQLVMYKVQIFCDAFYLCEPLNKFEME